MPWDQVLGTRSRDQRGKTLTSRGEKTALQRGDTCAGLFMRLSFLSGREPRTLVRFPHFTERFFQLVSVGGIAPLQVLQLLIFLLVQDPQEILQFWKAEGFPLGKNTKEKMPGVEVRAQECWSRAGGGVAAPPHSGQRFQSPVLQGCKVLRRPPTEPCPCPPPLPPAPPPGPPDSSQANSHTLPHLLPSSHWPPQWLSQGPQCTRHFHC